MLQRASHLRRFAPCSSARGTSSYTASMRIAHAYGAAKKARAASLLAQSEASARCTATSGREMAEQAVIRARQAFNHS